MLVGCTALASSVLSQIFISVYTSYRNDMPDLSQSATLPVVFLPLQTTLQLEVCTCLTQCPRHQCKKFYKKVIFSSYSRVPINFILLFELLSRLLAEKLESAIRNNFSMVVCKSDNSVSDYNH